MTNSYYNPNGKPAQATRALSADVRSELANVGAGFDKLPSPASFHGGTTNFGVDTGSANAYLVAVDSSITSLTTGLTIRFKAVNANTGASTVAVNALAAKTITRPNGSALAAGDIAAGQIVEMAYDSVADQFQLPISATGGTPNFSGVAAGTIDLLAGAAIASAATVNLNPATGNIIHITGNTTITAVTLTHGPRWVVFDGALTLTHNATTNNLPGAANITTAVGDRALYFSDGTTVYCVEYIKANGAPVTFVGSGSTTQPAGNVTLTKTSTALQRVSSSVYGSFVKFPDATTMPLKATPVFQIYNTGEFPMMLQDAGGNIRGWVYPQETVTVGLHDISSANGLWDITNNRLVATAALYANTALSLGTTGKIQAITIDSDRTLLLFGDTTVEAIVWTRSTGLFGAPQQVRATISSGQYVGILAATDKVLVVSEAGTPTTTSLQGVILSLVADAITVNTPNNPTLAAATSAFGVSLASFNGAFGFSYIRDTAGAAQSAVIGISVSTNTVAFGADVAMGTTGANSTVPHLYTSGASMVAFSGDDNNFTARSFTVSGNTLTGGTAATRASNKLIQRSLAYGSRWLFADSSTTPVLYGASLSGTTMTLNAGVTATGATQTSLDIVALSSTKLALSCLNTNPSFNVITDNGSGTISIGTAVTAADSTVAAFFYNSSGVTARYADSGGGIYTVDCSAASPSVSRQRMLGSSSAVATVGNASDAYAGKRNYANLAVGSWGNVAIPTAGTQLASVAVTPNGKRLMTVDYMVPGTTGCVGSDATESWVINNTLTNGVFIQAIRAASPA